MALALLVQSKMHFSLDECERVSSNNDSNFLRQYLMPLNSLYRKLAAIEFFVAVESIKIHLI